MTKLILAYWDVRCLVEPIRLILEYAGVEYEFKAYPTGEAPDYSRPEWKADKFSLGFDFPNVPYLIDGEVKLTESWAIMKYLGRKYDLYPQTEEEHQRCDVAQGVVEDFRYKFINLCYYSTKESFAKGKFEFMQNFAVYMDRFELYLSNHRYMAGDRLTYVDFGLFEALDQIMVFDASLITDTYPTVFRFMSRIRDLKGVTTYRHSNRFKILPLFSKYAYWGGQSE
uniref:glutathione transferase n=1 Tax=Ciona intestinalis TaxID=7719 RepID=F6S277_CIOIN|nr:glutathione S-transferase Mu 1-like [Ciona intestinalis]|eukprot:XP_002119880.1 glutathione S-transferase Mu 1-like [Ciona intestinalis]